MAVREIGDRILFVHRLEPGGADRSYGIEVGRLAGLPAPLLERARHLLRLLESEQLTRASDRPSDRDSAHQLGLFAAPPNPVVERLAATDVNTLTPVQALSLLDELVQAARNGRL